MKKIVFLVSGNGGHLKYLYRWVEILQLPLKIVAVIADRQCGALEFAAEVGIPAQQIKYYKSEPLELRQSLLAFAPDIIVTNIHKVIDAETLHLFPGKFINLHYSLLPAFGGIIGMKTLEEGKKQNVGFVGATCHYVNEEVDSGTVIFQSCFPVDWERPIDELVEITFRSACIILAEGVIKALGINEKGMALNRSLTINDTEVMFSPTISANGEKLFRELWPTNS